MGQFFKSLGLAIFLAIIGGIYYGIGYLMIQLLQENWTAIIILFFIFMFITFIFTKLISLLWRGMKFMYYFWLLAATIAMYVIFLTQAINMENSYLYYIVAEFTLLLFIVPECTSYWTHYIVTTYIDDVEVGHYFTKEYTSGTLVKLGFMTLGTAIFSLISYFGHETGFIVIFIGHCVYLGIMFLVGLVGYIKNG